MHESNSPSLQGTPCVFAYSSYSIYMRASLNGGVVLGVGVSAKSVMGNQLQSTANPRDESSSGVTSALTSLWNASSDKDDTCRTWGLVS